MASTASGTAPAASAITMPGAGATRRPSRHDPFPFTAVRSRVEPARSIHLPTTEPRRGDRRAASRSCASLPVAGDDEIGDEEKRVLVVGGREAHERLLGGLGIGAGTAQRVLHATVALDELPDVLDLARIARMPLEDRLDAVTLGGRGPLEGRDEGQRPLALLEIGADGLAEPSLVSHEVERVVAELERDADVQAVARERFDLFLGGPGHERADPAAGRDERRRLLRDDAEIVGLGGAAAALALELKHLGLRHGD